MMMSLSSGSYSRHQERSRAQEREDQGAYDQGGLTCHVGEPDSKCGEFVVGRLDGQQRLPVMMTRGPDAWQLLAPAQHNNG